MKNKKRFKLFDMNAPGKGVTKVQVEKEDKPDFFGFVRILKNRFWNISSLNILYIFINFPIFFGLIALAGVFNAQTTVPSSPFYPVLYGIAQYGETPYVSALLSVFGENSQWSVTTDVTRIFGYLTLLLIFTNGISNAGASYVIRCLAKCEPVFMLSDFFSAIKKNFKQAFVLGIIDCFFIFAFAYGIMAYYINAGTYMLSVMLFAEILLAIIYLTMRFYMYLLLVTFDLSIFKILKNSFIFSIVGFKRNIFAWIGIIFVAVVSFYLLFAIPMFGIILPFLITIALTMFMCGFAAYPIIKQYMIDPYYGKNSNKNINAAEEPVFKDRG